MLIFQYVDVYTDAVELDRSDVINVMYLPLAGCIRQQALFS